MWFIYFCAEWEERPGSVFVCEGRNASLIWSFTQTTSAHVRLTRRGKPVHFTSYYNKQGTPITLQKEVHLLQVTTEDNGTYSCEVVMTECTLHDTATVSVFPQNDCPVEHEFKNPELSFRLNPEHAEVILGRVNQTVWVGVKIPSSNIPVNYTITFEDKEWSSDVKGQPKAVVWVNNTFTAPGHYYAEITLQHVVLGTSYRVVNVTVLGTSFIMQYISIKLSMYCL